MQRIMIRVRYDGTEYSGSQIQPGVRTVEGTLKESLESLVKQRLNLLFASRTDAGVHADGNVATFDAELEFPVSKLPELLNRYLPGDLSIRDAVAVPEKFHPRFDAVSRTYIYRYYLNPDPPVDRMRYCAELDGQWDAGSVDEVLNGIHGLHEFTEFAQLDGESRSADCHVMDASQHRAGPEVSIEISANRFLRNMICRLAGALRMVAAGRIQPGRVLAALKNPRDFKLKPAPAKGLTLLKVQY